MNHNILLACIFLSTISCNQRQTPAVQAYEKSDGLMQLVSELIDPQPYDTFNLVLANNRTCNCGGADYRQIDSLVKSIEAYPEIWVLSDPDSAIEYDLRVSGRQYMYLTDINIRSYGLSSISPQVFTITANTVLQYTRLPR